MLCRRFSLITAVVLALALTACSKQAPKRTSVAPQTTAVTTIRVAVPVQGNASGTFDPVISAFQTAHPEYRVEKVPLNTPYLQVFLAQNQVDAIYVNTNGDDPMWSNLLSDLAPYVSRSKFDMNRYAVGTAEIQPSGKISGLPFLGFPRVIVANLKLFEAAGVPLPKDGWTWEEFRDTAARLTKPDHSVYGLTSYSLEFMTQLWLLQATGGQPARHADGDAMRGALTLFSGIALEDQSALHLARLVEGPLQKARENSEFEDRRAAMALVPLFPGLRERFEDPIAILPLPVRPGSKATLLAWYYSMAVPADAPDKEGGWEFVKFACGPEGAATLAKNGFLPVYMDDAVQSAWIQSGALGGEYVVNANWTGHQGSWSTTEMKLQALMDDTINRVLSGNTDLERALADYNESHAGLMAKP